MMQIIDHASEPRETWRDGVLTRMRISARNGSVQLCVFEQWCEPQRGAPTHIHAVEEVLTVIEGRAAIWVESEKGELAAGQSLIVPAGRKHGFSNIGDTMLHISATLAAPIFEAAFEASGEVPRRFLPAA